MVTLTYIEPIVDLLTKYVIKFSKDIDRKYEYLIEHHYFKDMCMYCVWYARNKINGQDRYIGFVPLLEWYIYVVPTEILIHALKSSYLGEYEKYSRQIHALLSTQVKIIGDLGMVC